MEFLPILVRDQIISYLNYVDVMSLRFTCSVLFNVFQVPDLYDRLLEEIGRFFKDPQKVIDNIEKYEGIISGSLAVKLLYNSRWDNEDIDIYVSDDRLFESFDKNIYYRYEYKYLKAIFIKDTEDTKYIQFINLDQDNNPINYIFNNFDTDICKVVLQIKDRSVKVLVKSWIKLIYKEDYILPTATVIKMHYCKDHGVQNQFTVAMSCIELQKKRHQKIQR